MIVAQLLAGRCLWFALGQVELNPDDISNLTWIPLADVANCPEESFHQGILELADQAIQLAEDRAQAYAARAKLQAAFG